MIKVYTDARFITPQNRRIIFPLLLDLCYMNNSNLLKRYQMVNDIDESDVVVVPVEIGYFFKNNKQNWLFDFIDKANALKKKVWVYTAGDFGITLNAAVYTFRLGGFESKLDAKTFIFPSFIIDPYLELKKEFKTIPKTTLPKIGFVGHADGSINKWSKEFLIYLYHNAKRITKRSFTDYQPFYPSSIKRFGFLMAMQKNNRIETVFILRNKYRAGVITQPEREQTTLAFFDNIFNNPYTFCMRGAGNFSVRFYETLAMGRIPFIIDTDIRMPLDNVIPWNDHCVIATENDFIEKLVYFHKNITEDEFERMQINNRNLWLNFLNREAYFNKIHTVFKEIIIK
jgi:hypothetical protein